MKNSFPNFIISLLTGALTTFLISVISLPLIVLLYESIYVGKTYDSKFWSGSDKNDLTFTFAIFTCLFIATMAGGISCTLISKTNANIQLLILIITAMTLIYLFIKLTPGTILLFISLTATCTAGYLIGSKIASGIQSKRIRQSR